MSAPRPRARVAIAAAVLAAAIAPACRTAPRPESLSVVLVTLDTTRADRIGAFGGTAVPTPNLDGVAHEGTIAAEAVSQVPLTLPSHATIMTGRYPASHGVRHNGIYRLRPEEETLAEHLKAAGFETAAFVGAYVLNRGFGIEQGFDHYDDVPVDRFAEGRDQIFEAQRSADQVNAAVDRYLDARKGNGRLFLWVHYYDAHEPYAPPESPKRTLVGRGYDREISYVDACFGDLLRELRAKGILDNALLVVAGDHGESLGEHGEKTHGIFLYRATLHVPLILRAPGLIPAGRTIRGPVELADIAPTIVDYLGLPPLARAQGVSLRPRIDGRDDGRAAVAHAETLMPRLEFGWSDLTMIEDGSFKYIRAPRSELYDLRHDPNERENLASVDRERAADMAAQLAAWSAATTDAAATAASARTLDPDEERRLRSLGYLSGGDSPTATPGGGETLVDPKDGIKEIHALDAARDKLDQGDAAGALATATSIIARNPRNHQARVTQVMALIRLNELPRAEDAALAALAATGSGEAGALIANRARGLLASVYRLEGKRRDAEAVYRKILAVDPGDEANAVDLARLLVDTHRSDEARTLLDGVLERDPRNGLALAAEFQLATAAKDEDRRLAIARKLAAARAGDPPTLLEAGELLMRAHDPAGAAACYAVVVEQAPKPDPDMLGKLGLARLQAGDLDGADKAFRSSASLRPRDPRAIYFLGVVAERRGDEAAARASYERALAINPGFRRAARALARLRAGGGGTPP